MQDCTAGICFQEQCTSEMAPYRDRASQGSASVDNNSDDSDSAGYRANVGTLLVN